MTKPKKPKPNPIEEAIGGRAKAKIPSEKATGEMTKQGNWDANTENFPQNPSEIADVPSPSEMLNLEELNRRTEERLQDDPQEEPQTTIAMHPVPKVPIILVSKPVPQPVTKTSSKESPPQGIVDQITVWRCPDCGVLVRDKALQGSPCQQHRNVDEIDEYQEAEKFANTLEAGLKKIGDLPPAEDIELTALRKYILEDGFVLATVAFHIVTLCAEPMTTPSTTTWDFKDRAMIPDMVLALLNQPGYLEGIWPSLRIVMGSNKGNQAWCAGIATTIAFFDTVRVLPALKEMKNEKKS